MENQEENIEINKPPETTNDLSKEEISTILQSTLKEIENLLKDKIQSEETVLKVNSHYPDIQSKYFQSGKFSFEGGLVGKSSFPNLQTKQEYIPVIKNLRLPIEARGKGLGSAIVNTWEQSMKEAGFKDFAITNLKGQGALERVKYWQSRGYVIPETEKYKKIPYYMSKRLD